VSNQASTESVDSESSAAFDDDGLLEELPALLSDARGAGAQCEELMRASALAAERARAAAAQARARLHAAERTAAELAALTAEAREVVAAGVTQVHQASACDGIQPA
jgi:hypothetical protein